MSHEAEMMQAHPSMLGFLVGSDYWPDDQATEVYLDALQDMDWPNPVIASASMRGYPEALGSSGMKMNGPYDWCHRIIGMVTKKERHLVLGLS
jgi:exo-1,4-beta-D-glucosaminidase